jgi:hypothetical protein
MEIGTLVQPAGHEQRLLSDEESDCRAALSSGGGMRHTGAFFVHILIANANSSVLDG